MIFYNRAINLIDSFLDKGLEKYRFAEKKKPVKGGKGMLRSGTLGPGGFAAMMDNSPSKMSMASVASLALKKQALSQTASPMKKGKGASPSKRHVKKATK